MKNFLFTGLRARLILFVLIIMLPVLGLVVYHGIEGRNTGRIEALDKARRLARNASMLYQHTILETRQILFTLSQMSQFHRQDSAACSKIFAELLKQTESYSGFAAAKPNGEVFASAPTITKPVSFADRPWFQHLVQTRGFVIGKYTKIGRISGKPTVVMGYPVLDHTGRLMTVITAGLDLERLQQTLLTIDLPDGATLNVIDSNGMILLRFPDPEQFLGKKMHDKSIVKAMLTKKEGAEEGIGLGGVPRLYGYTTIGSGIDAIHISAGIPEQAAFADVERHMVRNLALLGLVSALALLGAWLFSGILIISPVNRLIDVTKRVSDGDLAVRTGQSDASGELGLLASNFDRMAESLQRRREERRLAEEALRAASAYNRNLIEASLDTLVTIEPDGKITDVNAATETVTGYIRTELIGTEFSDYFTEPERARAGYQEVFRVGSVRDYPLELRHRDGHVTSVLYNASVYRDENGQVAGVFAAARDITERKKAEDMLRITQFSVDRAVEAVAWIGLDGRFLYVNDAHCRLLNYSKDEMLSMDILDIFDVDPRSSGEDWPEFWSKHKQEKTSYFESSCRTKDGMLIPVEINANYLSYEDKEFIVGFCRDISQRKLSEERLKRQIDRLAALRAIDMAITASLDIRVTFSIFLEQVINNLHVDAADVLVFNSHSFNKLSFVAGRGFRTNALRYTNLSIGEGFAGRVAQERKTICIPDLEKEAQDLLKISPQISSEDFVAYYGAPLIAKGQVKGVLEIFNRTPLEPDQGWLDFLEALATQAAIAADNAMLFDDLQKSNLDLLQAYDSTLEGWSNALDLRDRETEGHSQRVTEMTLRMARQMGMRDSELAHVRRGALLHDIGKMGIPDGILLKPGPLDDEEWEIMRKHPVYAYEFLYPISYLRPALDIPYSHHEKWDGTGYPRGLKGVHIPLAARIFAIVDVWDALRSDRPYRPAWPEEKVREHIREQTGKQFDPKVVEVFMELLNEFKPV